MVRGAIQDKSGSTAVEFAFVAPIFFLLIAAIVEIAMMNWGNAVIDNALLQVSRRSAVGCIRGDCVSAKVSIQDVRDIISQKGSGFIDVSGVGNDGSQTDTNSKFCIAVGSGAGGSNMNLGQRRDFITWRVSYKWPVWNPVIMLLNALGLTKDYVFYTTSTVVRNEMTVTGSRDSGVPNPAGYCLCPNDGVLQNDGSCLAPCVDYPSNSGYCDFYKNNGWIGTMCSICHGYESDEADCLSRCLACASQGSTATNCTNNGFYHPNGH